MTENSNNGAIAGCSQFAIADFPLHPISGSTHGKRNQGQMDIAFVRGYWYKQRLGVRVESVELVCDHYSLTCYYPQPVI